MTKGVADMEGMSFYSLLYANLGFEDAKEIILLIHRMSGRERMVLCAYLFALLTHGCSLKIAYAVDHLRASDSAAFVRELEDANLWLKFQITDVRNYVKSFVCAFGFQIHAGEDPEKASPFCIHEYEEILV